MISLVEPHNYISKLWGKQIVKRSSVYRLMKYVLRLDYKGKVLLHNVVSGQLVLLNHEETDAVNGLPVAFNSNIEQLVADHYLVPEEYDEHQQVLGLRTVIRKLDDAQGEKPILHYTILPTTACNARCYYCFEQGIPYITMSRDVADDVVEFISTHCGKERKIVITWFGGEPTVASAIIDRICKGLSKKGVNYRSKMTTNGYLFDQEMVTKAKDLWKLYALQICVDGTETSYNRIKSYVSVNDNPYQRVMRNIGLLLDNGIAVGLRMNFDLGNYREFKDVVDDAVRRFGRNKLLSVAAHPVIGEYRDHDGQLLHADDDWFMEKCVELNTVPAKEGISPPLPRLPFLNGDSCSASTGFSLTIRPDGGISRCAELFDDKDLIGTVRDGVINKKLDASWKQFADYDMCINCVLYPHCLRIANCPNKTYCHKKSIYIEHYYEVMRKVYNSEKSQSKGGKVE